MADSKWQRILDLRLNKSDKIVTEQTKIIYRLIKKGWFAINDDNIEYLIDATKYHTDIKTLDEFNRYIVF